RKYQMAIAHPRVRQVCEYLTRYLLDGAVQARPGVVRVRMATINSLFRVNVFWHLPEDQRTTHVITPALGEVLTVCLRDDERIVRVESLRAVAVALRNISVLLERVDDAQRKKLRARFFPEGVQTIQWLLDVLLENYARYRRHSEPVLLSTAWSYIT